MTTQEFIDSGMLKRYAKAELSELEMAKVDLQLTFDLALGEELERIYIAMEKNGD